MTPSERISKTWIRKRYNLDEKGESNLIDEFSAFLLECGVDEGFKLAKHMKKSIPVSLQNFSASYKLAHAAISKLEEACKA